MVYLVLGMHKSGTSLLAEVLHRSGIAMGDLAAAGAGADYDSGHKFEDAQVQALNKDLLGFGESYRLPAAPLRPDADQQAAMAALVATRQAAGGDWGFKDPRSVLTYDAWQPLLPPHRLLAVYRHPTEVWGHYRRHGPPQGLPWRRLRWLMAILGAWLAYNRRVLAILAAAPPGSAFLIGYEQLMDPGGSALADLEPFVGRPLVDARRPGQYRNQRRWWAPLVAYELLTLGRLSRCWRRLERSAAAGAAQRARLGR